MLLNAPRTLLCVACSSVHPHQTVDRVLWQRVDYTAPVGVQDSVTQSRFWRGANQWERVEGVPVSPVVTWYACAGRWDSCVARCLPEPLPGQ